MLGLKCETDPQWIEVVKKKLDTLIIDHAHAEKKAALTGLNLINAYPDRTQLCLAMADHVEEEIAHFRSVFEILVSRGISLTPDTGNEYAKKLFAQLRNKQPERLLDHLCAAGIIEARSCERLKILAENIDDEKLSSFYDNLLESEARRFVTFTNLARQYFGREIAENRMNELMKFEAGIVKNLSNQPMMHG